MYIGRAEWFAILIDMIERNRNLEWLRKNRVAKKLKGKILENRNTDYKLNRTHFFV